jgi:putative DNA-invertase from lambdoid prophage Rac
MRCAIYARVSTVDQEPENQLAELRQFATSRGWAMAEYVDRGVSGTKDSRPALDRLVADARRRKVDVLLCWRLDRLGRNLRHLVTLLDELLAVGVAFVSLNEGIDATTPAGKVQLHILAALAEFERERIRECVKAGLARARAQGARLGRPRMQPLTVAASGLTVRRLFSGACQSQRRRAVSRLVRFQAGQTLSQRARLSPRKVQPFSSVSRVKQWPRAPRAARLSSGFRRVRLRGLSRGWLGAGQLIASR